jgi:hypothetical protein
MTQRLPPALPLAIDDATSPVLCRLNQASHHDTHVAALHIVSNAGYAKRAWRNEC